MNQRLAMTREEALRILQAALTSLKVRFGVIDLAIFGSVARNEAGPGSDIDILVTFGDGVDFFTFMELQFELEKLLGIKIDLVTPKALKPETRSAITRDMIHVA
jgi:predicted nucleotidyltransferase